MTKIVDEIQVRFRRDFDKAVALHLPNFSAPHENNSKELRRYEAKSQWTGPSGGQIVLSLEFADQNRLYLLLKWNAGATSGLTRVDSFKRPPSLDELKRGFWCEDRRLPALSDIDDDFWVPTPPSARRFLEGLLATKKGRSELSYVIDDDDVLEEAKEAGVASESALEMVREFLELEGNPWESLKRFSKLNDEDISSAVDEKIDRLISVIASRGLEEFCSLIPK